ncbi:MAG: septal ring lytic transglycosylase RlpA family protein, partial [Actinomycetota bacterium]|nr:septal ring lytic transglycosylase RlpA family protein [Actinomycetota bacterium]
MPSASRCVAVGSALAAFLLPGAAAASTGGQPAPGAPTHPQSGAQTVSPSEGQSRSSPEPLEKSRGSDSAPLEISLRLPRRPWAFLGAPLRIRGTAKGAGGERVRVERRQRGGWRRIATVPADADGSFAVTWRPSVTGPVALRAVLAGSDGAAKDGAPGPSPVRRVTVYRPAIASWYGPGFYGNPLSCGGRLSPTSLGVAHRTLPCGTPVAIMFGKRSLVVPVIDRGPFIRGRDWDLTAATARFLGLAGLGRIGAA